ncbi:hypothetical protein MD484_g7596, partial [Candolleomyces efflorescens]
MSCAPSYTPSIADVFAVRRHLLHFVPAEIAVEIVELAQYWPKVSATREAFTGPASVPGIRRDGEWCYNLTPPLPFYPGATMKPREVKFTLDCAAGVTYDSICSSSTTFNAAIVKAKDLTQNILYEPLEATPERHINDWTISDPTRWLVQEVPIVWPVGSRHELLWKDDHDESELKEPEPVPVPVPEVNSTSNSTPTDNTDAPVPSAPSPNSLLDKLSSGDRVAVMVQGMIPGWLNCVYTVTTEVFYSI